MRLWPALAAVALILPGAAQAASTIDVVEVEANASDSVGASGAPICGLVTDPDLSGSVTYCKRTLATGLRPGAYVVASGTEPVAVGVVAKAGRLPEPLSWVMMVLGIGAIGFSVRRAVRRSERRFDARIKRIAAGLEP